MTEEQVTKAILKWLKDSEWQIVCFDFPQSGTGKMLHPNNSCQKNLGSIIPDIVAVKNKICLFFENKDRFYYPDYEKQNRLKEHNDYSNDINDLLKGYEIEQIYYGIGLPTKKHNANSEEASNLVDFIIGVYDDKSITIIKPYD